MRRLPDEVLAVDQVGLTVVALQVGLVAVFEVVSVRALTRILHADVETLARGSVEIEFPINNHGVLEAMPAIALGADATLNTILLLLLDEGWLLHPITLAWSVGLALMIVHAGLALIHAPSSRIYYAWLGNSVRVTY